MEWELGKIPEKPGWYAVLLCYDEREGAFPGAAYFDGLGWSNKHVVACGDMCDTKREAETLAYENDPYW